MKDVNIILLGYGRVGKAFASLIQEKKQLCFDRYDLAIHLSAVLNSRGGLDFDRQNDRRKPRLRLSPLMELDGSADWQPGLDFHAVCERRDFDVLVDCTPSDIQDGGPALPYTLKALERGWHVVTANKGPLVVDYDGIRKKAEKNRVSLGMSGATAAALPTLDMALHSLAGTEIRRIEGILNGTTNYILTRMNSGIEYPTALREAQEKGIAEPDPSQDVEGWDTAAKILIITNAVFRTGFTLKDVRVEGITRIPPRVWEKAQKGSNVLKLIGSFCTSEGRPKLTARPSLLEPSHPLYLVDGAQKGITFHTDTMDSVTVTGGKSDPRGAAAALLKDIINIYRKQAPAS